MNDEMNYDDENETADSDIEVEYDRVRREYVEREEKFMPEIDAILAQADALEQKAFALAETHGLALTRGQGKFVSSLIGKEAAELEAKFPDEFDRGAFSECITDYFSICYDWGEDIIEGYWEPSNC